MEHTIANPFVPRASIVRFPNGIFEMRIYIGGICSNVEVTPHDNYVLVSGRVGPRVRRDRCGFISSMIWTDSPCGTFSRDIQLRLSPGTQIVILERRQECDGLVIRYTLRNVNLPIPTCGQAGQFNGGGYGGVQSQSCCQNNIPTSTWASGYPGGNHFWNGNGNTGSHKDFGVSCTCGLGHHNATFNAGFNYDSSKGVNPQAGGYGAPVMMQGAPGVPQNANNGVPPEGFIIN